MTNKTLGFIGGGRVVRILLEGFRAKNIEFPEIVVTDTNEEALARLREIFPGISAQTQDNRAPASCDIVFLALHPPACPAALDGIKETLKPDSVLVSLAPKLTMARLTEKLGGFERLVRMIPNAPSIIGRGFNPLAFSNAFADDEKRSLADIFAALGDCPEVPETALEAYAVIAAMGPTYFWFQWRELGRLAESFGLAPEESALALKKMLGGSIQAYFESGLTPEQVMDLVPVKPLGEDEESIRNIYRSKLETLFQKLKA